MDHAVTEETPALSALQKALHAESVSDSSHPPHLLHLASSILFNLKYQHDWTSLVIQTHSTITGQPLSRPMISGIPPTRAYVHPDEQIEVLKAEHESKTKIEQIPEREWVLPTHIKESLSLRQFAAIFDDIETLPPSENEAAEQAVDGVGAQWRGKNRQKRVLLATMHDDSTAVYYVMHDGIVKPRQN